MTVVSLSSDSTLIKKVIWERSRIKNQRSFWLVINIMLLFSLITALSILVFQNIWHLNTRLEIQNLERKLLTLEEKNAELKNQWQELKNFYNFQKIAEENNLVLTEHPNYLTIKKVFVPLGVNSLYERNY